MAFKDVKNTAYNKLIALAEAGFIRNAIVNGNTVLFASAEHVEALKALGIMPTPIGTMILQQLQRENISDCTQYPFTVSREAIKNAIETAEPAGRSNYLLVSSVLHNAQVLPLTEEMQREVDCRKMMLR